MKRRLGPRYVWVTDCRGSVLVIVLWVCFGVVALVLYFAQSMNSELRVADNRATAIAAQEAADAGARYVLSVLSRYATNGTVPLSTDYEAEALPVGEATFWLIGRDPADEPATYPYFGLIDEASKLNLNTASRSMLESLPTMTTELAGGIIDWRDSNANVTENGAEDETYARSDPPRRTKNALFESVDELRLVNGATLAALLGEDTNRNGILDPNEDDGDASLPIDDRNGVLLRGVLDYVTVYSAQPNTRSDGSRRINLTVATEMGRVGSLLQSKFGSSRGAEIMTAIAGRPLRSVAEFMSLGRLTAEEFAQIHTDLTASSAATVRGLINVNTASEAVLACIPGIGPTKAASLVALRLSRGDTLTSYAWLTEVLDPVSLAQAGPYITDQSYQFSADIAAVGPHGHGYARVRYVFDTSQGTPRIVYRQDLTGYGWALGDVERDHPQRGQHLFR